MIAAIVETRRIPNIRAIVENHVHYSGFKPMVFHGTDNSQFMKDELKGLGCTFFKMDVGYYFDAYLYNKTLTSKFFWEHIPADKVLIFQHDSLLLRNGIKEFLQYDFIGAPIYHEHLPMPCMNGGLSLRSKSKMLEVIEKIPYDYNLHGNEDIYFCRGIEHIGGNLPTKEVASMFSVESIFSLGSLGCHAIDKYLTHDEVFKIMRQYEQRRISAEIFQKEMDKL